MYRIHWYATNVYVNYINTISYKEKKGRLGPSGIPGPDHVTPKKKMAHGAVFCLIRGDGPVRGPENGSRTG